MCLSLDRQFKTPWYPDRLYIAVITDQYHFRTGAIARHNVKLMLKNYILPLFLFLSYSYCFSQTVSTIVERSGTTFEAITWAPDGNIYVVDFSTGEVFRMEINGNLSSLGTLNGALGGAVDAAGNFYCSEFNTGRIYKIDSDGSSSLN